MLERVMEWLRGGRADEDKAAMYRAALEGMRLDGLVSAEEREGLAYLREHLGLSAAVVRVIEEDLSQGTAA